MFTKIVIQDIDDAFHGTNASIHTCRGRVSASYTFGQELPMVLQQGGPHLYAYQQYEGEAGQRSEVRWS